MASVLDGKGSHGQFILLLDASGVDPHSVDKYAQGIHDDYMKVFGMVGAFTVSMLRLSRTLDEGTVMELAQSWTHLIRYYGPRESVGWLRDRMVSAFDSERIQPKMQTFEMLDLTGRY